MSYKGIIGEEGQKGTKRGYLKEVNEGVYGSSSVSSENKELFRAPTGSRTRGMSSS